MTVVTNDIVFFTARTTDGNSSAYPMAFPNKKGQLSVYGTFGGATVTFQYSPDYGTTYIAARDAAGNAIAFTANGGIEIEAPIGELMRCVVSGATGPTTISAKLVTL